MDLNYVKNIIRSILVSTPEKLPVYQLQKDYQNFEGTTIPFKDFGYNNINAFLQTLTDTVCLRGQGTNALCSAVSNENNQHIAKLVSVQKKSDTKRQRRRPVRRSYNDRSRYVENNHWRDDKRGFYQPQNENRNRGDSEQKWYNLRPSDHSNIARMPEFGGAYPKVGLKPKSPVPVDNTPKLAEPIQPAKNQVVPEEPKKDADIFERALSRLANGNTSVLDKVMAKIAASEQTQLPKKPAAGYAPPCLRQASQSNETSTTLVPGSDMSSSLDDSLTEKLLLPLSTVLREDQRMAAVTYTNYEVDDAALPPIDAYNHISMIGVDEDVATIFHHIPDAKIVDAFKNLDLSELIVIYAAEFYSPHRFWFHLQSNSEKFDDMMERLNDYYCTLSDNDLGMGYCNITIGHICAARFEDHWSRAEIIGDLDAHNQVKINYVDYNTVRTVPMHKLKFLKQEFCTMPKQAFRGCLTHILPKTWLYRNQTMRCWHLGATNKMMEHMPEMVYCKIVHLDYKENITYMRCIDTMTSIHFDYTVNDVLCYHNYAFYDYGADRVVKDGDFAEIVEHFAKNYSNVEPTFKQLEQGTKPTYAELMENGFEDDSLSLLDLGRKALDELMPAAQNSSSPSHQSTSNPFVDVNINLNSTNPFIEKDYDLDKSLVLVNGSTTGDNFPSVRPKSPKTINITVKSSFKPNIPVAIQNYDSDSNSDNKSVLLVEQKLTDLSRTQQELAIKVDNMMQALESLKRLDLNDRQ